MKFVRPAIITVVVLALLGLTRLDRSTESPKWLPSSSEAVSGRYSMTATAGPKTIDTAWYCAAGRVRADLESSHDIIISNPAAKAVTARLTGSSLDPKAKPQPKSVQVAARSVITVPAIELGTTTPVAVTVEVSSGAVAVEHRLTTAKGTSTAPCSPRPAESWYFAYSNTEKDATARLFLFNPLSVGAIVDVTTATPEATRIPDEFQGVIVGPGQVKELNVNVNALRWEHVSLTVHSRSGLIVAELVQYFDTDNLAYNQSKGEQLPTTTTAKPPAKGASGAKGTSGAKGASGASGASGGIGSRIVSATTGSAPFARSGLALIPGVLSPQPLTSHVVGYTQPGVKEWLFLYNPGRRNATVEITVEGLAAPNDPAEPFQRTIPPGRTEEIKLEADTRVPATGFHRVMVRSIGSPMVVSSLVHFITSGRPDAMSGTQLRPSTSAGVSVSVGSPLAATSWLVPSLDISADDSGWIVVENPSPKSISLISVSRVANGKQTVIPGLNALELPPNSASAISVAPGPQASFVVTAKQPVVVADEWVDDETNGITVANAVPSGPESEALDAVVGRT